MPRIVAKIRGHWLPVLHAATLALLCSLSAGCYLAQAAAGQAGVMLRSRPIDRVLEDPLTDVRTREQLQLAQRARRFAIDELYLPDGRSYRRYADLRRPYAVWNVVATPEFSLQPRRWCFPITGCVSYRGYFREARARSAALHLFGRGDDVTVGGVPTYSTLGYLPDPIFNTMLAWREARLVGTIFHELAHERLYVQGDSEFNEAFATVVEAAGTERWFAIQGQQSQLQAFALADSRERDFSALLAAARLRLQTLYDSPLPPAQMRIAKQREFGRLQFDYEQQRRRWGGYAGYDAWFARALNNADLTAVATYQDCVPGLRRVLDAAGSWTAFHAAAEALAKADKAARHAAVCGPHVTDQRAR